MGDMSIGGNTPPPVSLSQTTGGIESQVQTGWTGGVRDGINSYNAVDTGKLSGLPPPDGQPDSAPDLPPSTGYSATGLANATLSMGAWLFTANQAGFRLNMMDIQKCLAEAMQKEKEAAIEANKSLFSSAKAEAQATLDKAQEQKEQALQQIIGPVLDLALSVGGAVASMRGVTKGLKAQKNQRTHDESYGQTAMAGKSADEIQNMQPAKEVSQQKIDDLTKKSRGLEIYGRMTSEFGRSASQMASNAVEAAHVESIAEKDAIAIMQRAMQEIFRRLAQAHQEASSDMYELMKSLLQDVKSQQDADVQNFRG